MGSDKGVKKEDLLKIKHADDIKNKLFLLLLDVSNQNLNIYNYPHSDNFRH